MALPKLSVPTYEIELPLSKRKLTYRPFLVKEQKNLLMAMEAGDSTTIQNNVRNILENCTITEGVDIDSLPIIDVEYYFINLRAKSVGEVVESRYKCNNEVEGKVCGAITETSININEIEVDIPDISPEIQLNASISIKLKYPEFKVINDSLEMDSLTDITFNMIANSIEYIYDGDQFYYGNEAGTGEMVEFVESMSQEQFDKVENFFNNLPKMKKKIEFDCKKCGFHHEIEVEGLESFFV